MAILSIKLKRPRVRIFRGRVILFKIGLIKKFIKPKITPITSKICQFSVNIIPKKVLFPGMISKVTPGTNFTAKKIAKIPPIICQSNFPIKLILFVLLRIIAKNV